MRVVVDIPDELYEYLRPSKPRTMSDKKAAELFVLLHKAVIVDGVPLPKRHGRLIDADALRERAERKTGKWVLSPVDGQLHCSACNRLLWDIAIMALGGLPNSCPWCCAEMGTGDA